jgi:hypothetical protein
MKPMRYAQLFGPGGWVMETRARTVVVHAPLIAVLVVLVVAGCGGGGGGGGGCSNIGGNFKGTANDNVFGSGTFVASVVQNGCSITGSAETCFQSLGCNSGSISGSVSGSSFSFTIFNGGTCTDVAQGSAAGNAISGTYARQGCNTGGGGSFSAIQS